MKFYRVVTHDAQCGRGYDWFTNKRDADSAIHAFLTDHEHCGQPEAQMEQHDITPTRSGIHHALKEFASHNDNG